LSQEGLCSKVMHFKVILLIVLVHAWRGGGGVFDSLCISSEKREQTSGTPGYDYIVLHIRDLKPQDNIQL